MSVNLIGCEQLSAPPNVRSCPTESVDLLYLGISPRGRIVTEII